MTAKQFPYSKVFNPPSMHLTPGEKNPVPVVEGATKYCSPTGPWWVLFKP